MAKTSGPPEQRHKAKATSESTMMSEFLSQLLWAHTPAFLVGAGISSPVPSGLPTGDTFHRALLQKFRNADAELAPFWDDMLADVVSVSSQQIRFEQTMLLLQTFLDENLELLNVFFEASQPNWYHNLFAGLMHAGHPILTTNFDCLIERAAHNQGWEFQCVIGNLDHAHYVLDVVNRSPLFWYSKGETEENPQTRSLLNLIQHGPMDANSMDCMQQIVAHPSQQRFSPANAKTLIKLHGSPYRPDGREAFDSIRTTLSSIAQLRGDSALDSLYQHILRQYTLVVVGYSGWDDFDVLYYIRKHTTSHPIIWFVHSPDEYAIIPVKSKCDAGGHIECPRTRKVVEFLRSCDNSDMYIVRGNSESILHQMTCSLGTAPAHSAYATAFNLGGYIDEWFDIYAASTICRRMLCAEALKYTQRWEASATIYQVLIQDFKDNLGPYELGKALEGLGDTYDHRGLHQDALCCFSKALDVYRSLNDPSAVAKTEANIGQQLLALGHLQSACDMLYHALGIFRHLSLRLDIGLAYYTLSNIARRLGNTNAEVEHLKASLRAARREGHLGLEALTLSRLSELVNALPEPEFKDISLHSEAASLWASLLPPKPPE